MRRGHFEALRPICIVCHSAPLAISSAIRETDDDILEGIAACTNGDCLREYPIIDGIPIFVANIRAWLSANPLQVLMRDDLSPEIESLIGDVLGAGSAYDTLRQHTSIYAESPPLSFDVVPDGPSIDIGCAVGASTFALAKTHLTLGIDFNFAMLRIASSALRQGRMRYARRRVGLVYDREEREVAPSGLVDFWCCDAANLPFAPATFAYAQNINVIDCLASPHDAIAEIARILRPNATAVIATPYDWSASATPVEQWLGGHSQRGPHHGASEPVLRRIVEEAGLTIVSEEESVPWRLRLHDRSTMEYAVHAVTVRKTFRTSPSSS
ncbi:MAG TPA: methyltransferase domain-containing protein [Thermoanaerobaculia bacterium]|nr:methyltransferase domain-containing protein [Thermoanaerobaculia bacterium]